MIEGQLIPNIDLTHLVELHIQKNSKLTLYLHADSKVSLKAKKEDYKVYGTFQEQEITRNIQYARLGFVTTSCDLKNGCEIDMGLLEVGGKIALWGNCKLIDICICSPLMIKYCLKKKHSSTSLFVFFLYLLG